VTSVIVFLLVSAAAWGATNTWNKTTTATFNWQDAANWSGGGFPSLAGDVANITLGIGAPTTINLGGGTITISALNRSGTGYHNIINGTLVFAANGNASISNRISATSESDAISADVTLNTNTIISTYQHSWYGAPNNSCGLKIGGVLGGQVGLYKDGPGMLMLTNDANSFAGTVTVANGVLYARHAGATAGWGVLGDAGNAIVLGSPGARGGLLGYQSSTAFTRPIELAGLGGMLIPPMPNVISNVISGAGELLVAHYDNLIFRGSQNNTYSGGTRIQNRYTFAFDNVKTFGTGDVKIEYSGRLFMMYPAVNVDPAAKVLVTSLGQGAKIGPNIVGGILILGSDSVPTIDTNSSGVIALGGPEYNAPDGPGKAAMSSGPNINTRFATNAATLGNGYMHYGFWSRSQAGTFTGSSLQPSLDGMYRFTCGGGGLTLDRTSSTIGVLTGTNGVEVFMIPGNAALLGPTFNDVNDFSGPLKLHENTFLSGYVYSSGGSSFGATNGPLEMKGGFLRVQRAENALSIVKKGTLTFENLSILNMFNSSATYTTRLDVASMVRTNGGMLVFSSQYWGFGTFNQITVSTPPAVTHGIVPPYLIWDNGGNPNTNLFFLGYVVGAGFTNAPFTAGSLTGAVASSIATVTNVESVPPGGIEVYALKTKKNLSSNGSADKIKIGSGGLILHGSTTNTAPIDFGDNEGVIYCGGSASEGYTYQLSGNLSGTNGLTIGGDRYMGYPAPLTISTDNSSSLTGTVTINHGAVVLIQDSVNLGPDRNPIMLNGGTGGYLDRFGALGPAAAKSTNNHAIWLGPEGGSIYCQVNGRTLKLAAPISGPGFLAVAGNTTAYITNDLNDYAGGTVLHNSGTLYVGYDGNTVSGLGRLGPGPVVLGAAGGNGTLYLYGTNNVDPNSRVLVLRLAGPGSLLGLYGRTTRIGSLEGDGQVFLTYTSSPACKLYTGGNDASTEFSGIIYDNGGTGSLVKEGSGTFTLSGYNTYASTTTVYQGTLLVNGTVTGPTVVTNGAVLGGKGVMASPVTLTGGKLAPGSAGKGVLTVNGNVTFDAASTYQVTLAGTNPGVDYGQLSASGTINLNGAALSITLAAAPQIGQQFTIMDNPAGATIGGSTFAGGSAVTALPFNGKSYAFGVNYAGGPDGKDVVLTVLPTGTIFMIR
jgi:autotransporter-associated beta strand protein